MPLYRFYLEFKKSDVDKQYKDILSNVFEKLFIFIKTDVLIKKYLKKYKSIFTCPVGDCFIRCETDNYKIIRRVVLKAEQIFKEMSVKDDDWINDNIIVEQQPHCSRCNHYAEFSDDTCSNCGSTDLTRKIHRLDELRVI